MSDSMTMSVSSVVSTDGKKRIYVNFADGNRSAELTCPKGNVMSNKGFSEKEMAALKYYVTQNKEQIMEEAAKVNIARAFMGDDKS